MSKLLLNLRHVPEDEADEVRTLLDAHGIAWFEARPSRWGVSAGSIWIREDEAAPEAARLMADYQTQRLERARSEHAAAQRDGTLPTMWTVARDEPGRVLWAVIALVFVLGLMALPVFLLSQ
jgi:hypothetical protein